MKTYLLKIAALLFSVSGCMAKSADYKSVDVKEFEKVISDSRVVRLDVRTAEEYAEGHIADAINIDVQKDDFLEKAIATLPKGRTIAVNCRSGKRSKKAAEILSKKGYAVVDLNEGIVGWTQSGKSTTKEEVDLIVSANGECIYLYCIKHGSVKMRIGEKWIYIDPVGNAVPPATDFSLMPKADAILITHEHHDHLDAESIRQLSKEGTLLVVNPRSSELLGGKGVVMKNGDENLILGNIQLNAVPAYNNSSDKQQFHPKGRDNGYVLTVDGVRIYLAGDTEDIEEMKSLKDVDVAFMPCNLPYTMSPDQLSNAAKMVMPKILFPYHYGKTDVQQVSALLEGSGIDVRIRQYQ